MMLAVRLWRLVRTAVVAVGAISLLFLGLSKFVSPGILEAALATHGVVPEPIAFPVALGVATLEVAVGGACMYLLLQHRATRPAAAVIVLALVPLAVYATWLVIHPPPAPAGCGCGFRRDGTADWASIAMRNGFAVSFFALLACVPPSDVKRT